VSTPGPERRRTDLPADDRPLDERLHGRPDEVRTPDERTPDVLPGEDRPFEDRPFEERADAGRAVVARQREAFGGTSLGATFFGYLAATGLVVLVATLAVAVGAALGVEPEVADDDVAAVGLWGAIGLAVLVLVAYACGGYVAGRMARFDGARQGLGVWFWALLVAVVVGVLAAVSGRADDVAAQLAPPARDLLEGGLTTPGVLAAVGIALVALLGAVLGGLLGVRFHRKVDRAGFGL